MKIRPARTDDAPAIAAILNPIIRDTTISFKPNEQSLDEVRALIEGVPAIYVAEDETTGRVLGYACYDQFRKGLGYARSMEHTIVVAPEGQGQGVGRALMDRLSVHAREAGIGSLWGGVSGENPSGLAFHLSVGFEEVARLPKVGFKFGRWLDLTLVRKWLDPEGDATGASD